MKKCLSMLLILFCSHLSQSQEKGGFLLSEEESRQIVESPEFQNFSDFRYRFIEIINTALTEGKELSSINRAAKEALETGKDETFFELLFKDTETGEAFINGFVKSKTAFLEKNKFIEENRDEFICTTCSQSVVEECDLFFANFRGYRETTLNSTGNIPTCGSYWNQLKLLGCVSVCGIGTGGLATVFCGWSCWCSFCTKSSELSKIICPD